jgi:pyrimidine operon attenuation protein/uracil phosphoribosyltransferase
MEEKTIVLHPKQVQQKIQRIAFEILEHHHDESEFVFIGIKGNGSVLANRLAEQVKTIAECAILIGEVAVFKSAPQTQEVSLSVSAEQLQNKIVILIDDVLNSGATMQYALVKILGQPVKSIKTVALVDRKHRRFPIRCDYVGLTLSTTLQDRIEVEMTEGGEIAYLV